LQCFTSLKPVNNVAKTSITDEVMQALIFVNCRYTLHSEEAFKCRLCFVQGSELGGHLGSLFRGVLAILGAVRHSLHPGPVHRGVSGSQGTKLNSKYQKGFTPSQKTSALLMYI
jgi:hypothetical protein